MNARVGISFLGGRIELVVSNEICAVNLKEVGRSELQIDY